MDCIAIHTHEAFEDKRKYIVEDTLARIERGWPVADSFMQNAGLIAETFLYVMEEYDASLIACTYLIMNKRPPEGHPISGQLALAMGRIGQALRVGGKAIEDGKTQNEIEELAESKLFDSHSDKIVNLLKYYLRNTALKIK